MVVETWEFIRPYPHVTHLILPSFYQGCTSCTTYELDGATQSHWYNVNVLSVQSVNVQSLNSYYQEYEGSKHIYSLDTLTDVGAISPPVSGNWWVNPLVTHHHHVSHQKVCSVVSAAVILLLSCNLDDFHRPGPQMLWLVYTLLQPDMWLWHHHPDHYQWHQYHNDCNVVIILSYIYIIRLPIKHPYCHS